MRILAVSGDSENLSSLEIMLGSMGFNVYGTQEGTEAVDLGKLYAYDAIVLSEIEDMHVDTVIRSLRNARVPTPILVASTKPCHSSVVAPVLDLGADDYVSLRLVDGQEIAARLHAIVRRARGHTQSKITVGELVVNLDTKTVQYAEQPIHFTGKEYQMIELFALRKGCVQTKEQILSALYGGMDEPELKIIDVFVCKLRRKLANAGAPEKFVETVWGRGYLIRGDAENVTLAPDVSNPVGRADTGLEGVFGHGRVGAL